MLIGSRCVLVDNDNEKFAGMPHQNLPEAGEGGSERLNRKLELLEFTVREDKTLPARASWG